MLRHGHLRHRGTIFAETERHRRPMTAEFRDQVQADSYAEVQGTLALGRRLNAAAAGDEPARCELLSTRIPATKRPKSFRRQGEMAHAALTCVTVSAGATEYFEHIGSRYNCSDIDTESATQARGSLRSAKLRWRVSAGTRRSLGWIPFKAASIRRDAPIMAHVRRRDSDSGESALRSEIKKWQSGCSKPDAVGTEPMRCTVSAPDETPTGCSSA